MAQVLRQTQEQVLTQEQQLAITAQQLLSVKVLGMSLEKLEEDINATLDDNEALEKEFDSESLDVRNNDNDDSRTDDEEYNDNYDEASDRKDELDKALDEMGRDDDMADFAGSGRSGDYEETEIVYADSSSFYDNLKEQIGEVELSETDRKILEYLIASIDNDGFLRKDLSDICDELAIFSYIDTTPDHIEEVLYILQSFDPPGIGARNLQECLLIQIEKMPDSELKDMMTLIINDYIDMFMKKHFDKIKAALQPNEDIVDAAIKQLCKLNPRPGSALSESVGISTGQIRPDFIVEVDDEGTVTFSINKGDMPKLKVTDDYIEQVNLYKKKSNKLTRDEQEAYAYYKDKVNKGNMYIEAIRQRYQTMTICMRTLIHWQKKYFVDGDEAELRPMTLKDISDKTGYDMSTVSRFKKDKYVDTPWGIKSLDFFFINGVTNEEGDEIGTMKIKVAIKEIIDAENKKKPLSDEALTAIINEKGFPIARRTVQKYREQMGIASSRLRKN